MQQGRKIRKPRLVGILRASLSLHSMGISSPPQLVAYLQGAQCSDTGLYTFARIPIPDHFSFPACHEGFSHTEGCPCDTIKYHMLISALCCVCNQTDRDVKKATRDMSNLLSSIESPMSKLDVLHQKYKELVHEMKRLDRDHVKSKKRGDQLQKEKDTARSELSKTNIMKEKLEKLARDLQKDNKKMKVRNRFPVVLVRSRKGSTDEGFVTLGRA